SGMSRVSKLVITSDSCEILAEGIGNLEGPTTILVHGLGSFTVVFDNLFKDDQLLSKVRYDMRSHGKSGTPVDQSNYSSPKFTADFMTVIEGFNQQKPYLFGTVVMDDCTRCPTGYLSGVIYVSALPCIGPIMMDLGEECLENLQPKLFTRDDRLGRFQDQ
ncbi:uncharacterized protein BJ212DRAFT_1292285, partial [Suillus subaureus]